MLTLANKQVGETGLGLMGFTSRPHQVPDEQAFAAMKVNYLFPKSLEKIDTKISPRQLSPLARTFGMLGNFMDNSTSALTISSS